MSSQSFISTAQLQRNEETTQGKQEEGMCHISSETTMTISKVKAEEEAHCLEPRPKA